MSDPRVADARMWAAIRDVLSTPRSDHHQWVGVADYAARRGPDPWPDRVRDAGFDSPVEPALEMIGSQLADALGDSPLRARALEWLAEDAAAAAPLLNVFTGHGTDVEHPVVRVDAAECDLVAAWLSGHWQGHVSVVDATVIGGGFSRRMWRVVVDHDGIERRIIVRIEQGGMFGTDTQSEVAVMSGLLSAGYSVPRILAVEPSGSVLGEPFLVMEEVAGEVRLDDDGIDDVIRGVAQLHRVPCSAIGATGDDPKDVIARNIDELLHLARAHSPVTMPLIEHAAGWLHAHLQPTGPSVILHGDAGPGNALFHPEHGLTMLDWEFAHVGDAAEDWLYLAVIRGRRIMTADQWRARLNSVAGVSIDDEQWRNWLAFKLFWGACVNLTARTVFERTPNPTADQLAIGVAVHLRFLSQLVEITCA